MTRSGRLQQWLSIQEQKKQEAETQAMAAAHKLTEEEQRLQALNNFRNNNPLSSGTIKNGLTLNNTQQFHDQLDKIILHQNQQVAVQQSQQRRKNQELQKAQLEMRKTEVLMQKYHQEEQLEASRSEQKQLDEMASIMSQRQNSSQQPDRK